MGRTGDRFGNRRHPLFAHAKELVVQAVAAATGSDNGQLAALLDAKMDTLPAEQFEEVMGLAYLELRQRKGANAAIEYLVSTTRDVSQSFVRESDGSTITLFGLVLQLPAASSAASLVLSPAQVDAAVSVMVQHRLLASSGGVVLVPRLLSAHQANALLAGEVYALTRALACNDVAAVIQVFERGTPATAASGSEGHLSTRDQVLVLVGVVDTEDGTPYPLPAELASRLSTTEMPELQPVGYSFAPSHVLEGLHRKLAAVCTDLSPALGRGALQALQPAGAFAQASMHAMNLARTQAAQALLARLSEEHGHGQPVNFAVGRPVPSGSDAFAVPVHRQVDGKQVGVIHWQQARYEPPRDALLQLLTFLQEVGLLVDRDPPQAGLLH